jgi:regulator of protease activity HflC (stomatin/prohibitin superfamily)
VITVLVLGAGIKVAREDERLVIFRLGRFLDTRGPGVAFLIPMVDRAVRVSLRERVSAFKTFVEAGDGAQVSIDMTLTWKISDPALSVTEISDIAESLQRIAEAAAAATLRDHRRDEVRAAGGAIKQSVHAALAEAGTHWGVEIIRVEIGKIAA